MKFRAWDIESSTMFPIDDDSQIFPRFDKGELKLMIQPNDEGYPELREEVVLMQFIGLKDKNGKEIYEGDILKHRTWEKGYVEIKNIEEGAYLVLNKEQDWTRIPHDRLEREVIGNIYENPELMEE